MLGRDADRDASSRRAAPRGGCARCCGKAPAPGRMRTGAGRPEPAGVATAAPPRPTDDRPTRGDRRAATGAPGSPGSTGSTAGAKTAARRPAAFDR
ncbi:hypothetical protein SZ29_18155 [Burkholderia pseudomallei]|nr:hypothetical protein SZ29_18155 [Burkholderia pseudomallei]